MRYDNISPAIFLERPNRFIAHILHEGEKKVCHVKNTGRCRELLLPGAEIFVQKSDNPKRKTGFDLIAVNKGGRLINMDANAPNTVFGEYLRGGGLGFMPELVKSEAVHGESRYDFYFEHGGKRSYAEVKGVTLENEGIVRFPDAPTQRGVKHLRGLIDCVGEGFEAYAVFIIQMKGIRHFEPNYRTHREFGETLKEAEKAGVRILVYDCNVERDSLSVSAPVDYIL